MVELVRSGNLRYRDADDRPISTRAFNPARDAVPTVKAQSHLGPAPTDAPCSVGVPADAVVRGSRWLAAVPRLEGLPDRAVQACLQTRFTVDGVWAEATVLVDAAAPGQVVPLDVRAGGTPARAVSGAVDRKFVVFEPFNVTRIARRPSFPIGVPRDAPGTVIGKPKSWLVVRSASAELRHRLAREITVQLR